MSTRNLINEAFGGDAGDFRTVFDELLAARTEAAMERFVAEDIEDLNEISKQLAAVYKDNASDDYHWNQQQVDKAIAKGDKRANFHLGQAGKRAKGINRANKTLTKEDTDVDATYHAPGKRAWNTLNDKVPSKKKTGVDSPGASLKTHKRTMEDVTEEIDTDYIDAMIAELDIDLSEATADDLMEISKQLAAVYKDNASDDYHWNQQQVDKAIAKGDKRANFHLGQAGKRAKGINRANKTLAKEETQLDEISSSLAKRYMAKAEVNHDEHAGEARWHSSEARAAGTRDRQGREESEKLAAHHRNKADRRWIGYNSAKRRVKEDLDDAADDLLFQIMEAFDMSAEEIGDLTEEQIAEMVEQLNV